MNIGSLSKSIIYHDENEMILFIIKNNFHKVLLFSNPNDDLNKNPVLSDEYDKSESLSPNDFYKYMIEKDPEKYWKIALDAFLNLTIPEYNTYLYSFNGTKNFYNYYNDVNDVNEKLSNLIYAFIELYFSKIKTSLYLKYLNKANYVFLNRFSFQLKKYCKKNFLEMHKDFESFIILSRNINISNYGDHFWDLYEKSLFPDFFENKLIGTSEYEIFWQSLILFQRVPNLIMKKLIHNFIKSQTIKKAILSSVNSPKYLELFDQKMLKQIKNI